MTHRTWIAAGVMVAACAFIHASPNSAPPSAPLPSQIKRAERIVQSLSLHESSIKEAATAAVAAQYAALSSIQATRDAAIKEAKLLGSTDKAASEAAIHAAQTRALDEQRTLHAHFLSVLAQTLTPAQVEKVKDAMTYGVLPLTYRVYQEMIPGLTAEQKSRILAWLTEARELAMDGGSSEEKHAIFGRYKGRINNYLSAAGIDMKKAEQEMMERKKAASAL